MKNVRSNNQHWEATLELYFPDGKQVAYHDNYDARRRDTAFEQIRHDVLDLNCLAIDCVITELRLVRNH